MDETRICWFCGTPKKPFIRGESIGSMVYSADFKISAELQSGDMEEEDAHKAHRLQDCISICRDCLGRLRQEVGSLEPEYVDSHMKRRDAQVSEVLNRETNLASWQEIRYPYGCWLGTFPANDIGLSFRSQELGLLFENGLRLHGKVRFEQDPFTAFLERYADKPGQRWTAFLEHASDHISIDGISIPDSFGNVRAEVYDVSIFASSS